MSFSCQPNHMTPDFNMSSCGPGDFMSSGGGVQGPQQPPQQPPPPDHSFGLSMSNDYHSMPDFNMNGSGDFSGGSGILGAGSSGSGALSASAAAAAARQKRMRTSFKHHQIRTMKSYFALNHNPDAKDLKQLAQKTGLSKRILQVCLFII